ncbi:AAA family ATPase [Pectobacterium versatile]|nr:AAA family ATPase [Pectobacterium versatile]
MSGRGIPLNIPFIFQAVGVLASLTHPSHLLE